MTDVKETVDVEEVEAKASSGKNSAAVMFKGEISIFPSKRLDYLDRGIVRAYAALTKGNDPAFAVVCEKAIVPQLDMVTRYAGVSSVVIPKLIASGVVEWTPDHTEKYAFVFENILGNPIWKNGNPNALGMKPDIVLATVFRNIVTALEAMSDKGVNHGGIRVTNIFDGGKTTMENAMIGECISTPPGYAQPALYESLQRAAAHPLGKGPVEAADDMYALGVALTLMIRHHDTTEGMSDEEIVTQKIEQGTFNLLTAKDRFPGPVLELLRGLLNDDPAMRWTLEDLSIWFEGRRVSAKQGVIALLKASRPVDFSKKKYLRPIILGLNFHKDPASVIEFVEKGELFLWLNRSLQNKETEGRYELAIEEAKKADKQSFLAERLAACMGVAMAPGYPLFYRGLKIVPAGLGALLVEAIHSHRDLTPFVDFIQSGLATFWITHAGILGRTSEDMITRIENCRMFMKQNMPGYGIERCIYYLSPSSACLSEKLAAYHVRSAEDYLHALEKISKTRNRPDSFLDRHIIAFLLVSDKNIIEPYLPDINAAENFRQKMGVLKLFTAIQRRDKMAPMPGLTEWVVGQLGVLVDRHHDRELRKKIKAQLEKFKDKGSFEPILALFDSFEVLQHDMRAFNAALHQFQMLRKEYFALEFELENNKQFGVGAGRQTAALVSAGIAALVVMVYLFFNLAMG
ncbi:MAG: hypothetical protein WC043_03325 [Pseudobdellovibrionaceae bacterium]